MASNLGWVNIGGWGCLCQIFPSQTSTSIWISTAVDNDINGTATLDNCCVYPNINLAPLYDPVDLKLLIFGQILAPPILPAIQLFWTSLNCN